MNLRATRVFAAAWCASTLLASCNGVDSPTPPFSSLTSFHQAVSVTEAASQNVVKNGSFASGKLVPWTSCGTAPVSISKLHPHNGRYDALTGSHSMKREVNGWSAICQRVTVPADGKLSAWLYRLTNEPNERFAYQEVALADSSNTPAIVLAKTNDNKAGWKLLTWDLAKYAGKAETLFFGVRGSGRVKYYDTQFIDDVRLTGTAGTLPVAKPTSLTFSSGTGQTFTVQESGYTGTLSASTSNAGVSTVGPSSASGPNATFTVTPVGGGNCTITVEDASEHKATIAVTVDNGIIIIDHSNVKHSDGGY